MVAFTVIARLCIYCVCFSAFKSALTRLQRRPINEVNVAKILLPLSTGAERKCGNRVWKIEKWLYLCAVECMGLAPLNTGNGKVVSPGLWSWVGDELRSNEDLVFCFPFAKFKNSYL